MEIKRGLICGDSFAATALSNEDSWPAKLSKVFKVDNVASPGVGEYKILQQVKGKDLSRYDWIIISHTSPYRIHTLQNPLYPSGHIYRDSDLIFADVESKLPESTCYYQYFTKMFDKEYYEYIHHSCCRDIDLLSKNYNTIHITHFDWLGYYQFQNNKFYNFYKCWKKNSGKSNHYNTKGNELVFEKLYAELV